MTQVYDDVRQAIDDAQEARRRLSDGQRHQNQFTKIPAWLQLVIAVGTLIVVVTLGYAKLDARIAVLESKMDLVLSALQVRPK
jgi:hypothetical protein